MKKYHPHGDQSVYDALVRMAQDFSLRYPLVDGHGNFGSVDGDPAGRVPLHRGAARRRWRWRCSATSRPRPSTSCPNFDGYEQQPVVLPARFPNLLVNGSGGIAVGMATNIPPHNLGEVIDAVVHYLDNPESDAGGPDEVRQGPRLPDRRGIDHGPPGHQDAYETGPRLDQGARVDARSRRARTARSKIVVTELPYQVNKARLAEKIAELVKTGKIKDIADLKDESSDREGMRLVDRPEARRPTRTSC